ncbi:hypothetical protein GCM10027064_05890 [Microbacterium petrolearium]
MNSTWTRFTGSSRSAPPNQLAQTKSPERNTMCARIICPACGKPTWDGCGQHIEQALAGVPENERCSCN